MSRLPRPTSSLLLLALVLAAAPAPVAADVPETCSSEGGCADAAAPEPDGEEDGDSVRSVHLLQLAFAGPGKAEAEAAAGETVAAMCAKPPGGAYGRPGCRCVGVEYPASTWAATGKTAAFHALGARCAATGVAAAKQYYCMVDPCNCDTDAQQEPAIGDATFQEYPGVYYSFPTCGSMLYLHKSQAQCPTGGRPRPEPQFGMEGCRCVGLTGITGTIMLTIKGESVKFPLDVGSSCKAWDDEHVPECKGDAAKPAYCTRKWCNVDPCSCDLGMLRSFFQGAMYQGRPLFISYRTCGETDPTS